MLAALAPFDPHVAGTPPLGIDLPSSDIDILCHAPDPDRLAHVLWQDFSDCAGFSLRHWTTESRPLIASFSAHGWMFEIFGSAQPVAEQPGWLHFQVEKRLLALGGQAFHAKVMAARHAGTKTEPAFAAALALPGNPYDALAALHPAPDDELALLIARAGF
ncbi:DUF4269 domain-containing protein [Sphingomonas sp. LaA6.9]|nr:DUF4269 domain-containing protein [Sphingomonas sp. LaA6.9]